MAREQLDTQSEKMIRCVRAQVMPLLAEATKLKPQDVTTWASTQLVAKGVMVPGVHEHISRTRSGALGVGLISFA